MKAFFRVYSLLLLAFLPGLFSSPLFPVHAAASGTADLPDAAVGDGGKNTGSLDPEKQCQKAAAFMKAGLYKHAAGIYEAILSGAAKGDVDLQCAREGLVEATGNQLRANCETAAAFMRAGMYKQAEEKYAEILTDKTLRENGADLRCARDGLVEVTRGKLQYLCKTASVHLKTDRPVEAEALYSQILKDVNSEDEEITCAKKGLAEVAGYYMLLGDDLASKKDLKGAEKAYESALKADADSRETREKLARVQNEEIGRRLQGLTRAGLEDKALELFRDELKTNPAVDEHIGLIEYLGRPRLYWRQIRQSELKDLPRFLKILPSAVAGMPLIDAVIILVFLFLFGRKFLWGIPTLNIKQFVTEEKEQGANPDFSSMVEQALIDLTRVARSRRGASLEMITGPAAPVGVQIGTILPAGTGNWTEAAQKVLGWLAAKPALVVTGSIHGVNRGTPSDNSDSARITVRLESGNSIVAKREIRAEEFGIQELEPGKCIEQLAECVAVWAVFAIRQQPVQLLQKFWMFIRNKTGFHLIVLGTRSWQSYAWFLVANRCYRNDDSKGAEAAFLKALSLDSSFSAARVNLAGVYHSGADSVRALEQLHAVRASGRQRFFGYTEPSLYIKYFRLAAIHEDLKNTREALLSIEHLLGQMKRSRWLRPFNHYLRNYLEFRRLNAECWKLGLEAEALKDGPEQAKKRHGNALMDLEPRIARMADHNFLYNLSCTCAMYSTMLPGEGYDAKSLSYLDQCLELAARMERNPSKVKRYVDRALLDGSFAEVRTAKPVEFEGIIKKCRF